jgi:hypothetical protein
MAIEQEATRLLSEQPSEPPAAAPLEDLLREVLDRTEELSASLSENGRDQEEFAQAAFVFLRAACRITGADGASLYSSTRRGYLDRQAFCWDPALTFEQMRTTSQIAEHVEVGDGIAGFLALDAEARSSAGYELSCPIRTARVTEVWDIPLVDELPERLRSRTTELMRQGTIDIGSMFLLKAIGTSGTDFILQLIRKRANGQFSPKEKLIAELIAHLVFPQFRSLSMHHSIDQGSVASESAAGRSLDTNDGIRQIAADAYDAIREIAGLAMEKIDKSGRE